MSARDKYARTTCGCEACRVGCRGGKLIGYAIRFKDGWDAWSCSTHVHHTYSSMTLLLTNSTREKAILAIRRAWENPFKTKGNR